MSPLSESAPKKNSNDCDANIDTLLNGETSNTPFLRTQSNADLFSALDGHPVPDPCDWAKFKTNNSDFHSLSHTTLVASHEEHNPNGYWPFAYENPMKINGAVNNSSTELVLSSDDYIPEGQEKDATFHPEAQGPGVMDTIKYLGEGTFSTSFVEKVMQQSDPMADDLLIPTSVSVMNPYMHHPPMYQNQEYFWHEHRGHPVELVWQNGNQISMHPHSETSSRVETKSSRSSKATDLSANRRRILQHTMECYVCNAKLGIAFIRGLSGFNGNPALNLTCQSCLTMNSVSDCTERSSGSEKKRKRRETRQVDCEVCHLRIGSGGINTSDVEVKVEYVCLDCGDKYLFCSECGGGGKQRTGKWRPRELFEQGRRTCSLPHIRVGSAEIHYKVIPVEELTADILQGIQDVFFDCMLSLYCIPTLMTGTAYRSFAAIKQEIERLWLTSVLDVLTNSVLEGRKYITVAWIHKRHRNKGVGRPNAAKGVVPWLQKLGLAGIIPPPKPGSEEESDDQHHCFVAFSIAEWDPASKTIFMAQMAPRSVFLKTMEGYQDLLKHCVEYIRLQARRESFPLPEHIWCWAKSDHARLHSIPARLKFVPREDYLNSHPSVKPMDMERPNYEPLFGQGTYVFAASVKHFLT